MKFYDIRRCKSILFLFVFKIFRTSTPASVMALLLITLITKLYWLAHPAAAVMPDYQKIWIGVLGVIQFFIGHSPLAMTFFAIINLTGQAIYLNRITTENDLFQTRNYLPAICFVLFSGLFPEWNYLSASLISNWFILAALSGLLQMTNSLNVRKDIFNIGLFISCAAILSLPALIFLPLLFVALSISRPFKADEWLLGLLGFLTPIYFLAAGIFLFGDWHTLSAWLPADIYFIDHLPETPVKTYSVLGLIILLLIVGIIYLNQYSEHKLIQVKKRWSLIITGFFLALIPLVFKGIGSAGMSIFTLIFLSAIVANIWIERKNKWIGRILFYVFLAVLIFAQWIQLP